MLNHASGVNRKRMDARIKKNRELGRMSVEEELSDSLIDGKKLTELTSDDIINLQGRDGPKPKVIKSKRKD